MEPRGDRLATRSRPPAPDFALSVGAYLCSERDLYCVEHLGEERAVVEDCRTGRLVDVSLMELSRLQRVRPA